MNKEMCDSCISYWKAEGENPPCMDVKKVSIEVIKNQEDN